MAIRSLPWRPVVALLAAVAAVLALAMPAGASTGTAQISPEQAGYTATGAQFKTIDARVFLRQPTQYAGEVASFGHSVQLWTSGLVVYRRPHREHLRLGLHPLRHDLRPEHPSGDRLESERSVLRTRRFCTPVARTFFSGVSWTLRINYLPEVGQVVHVRGLSATAVCGDDFTSSYDLTAPQSFTQARVGTEFGSSPWDASYPHTPPASSTKVAAYNSVSLTTYSGHKATLWSWWVHHKLLANTGQQSGSDWVAVPADLSNGGASFQTFFLPQSAQGRP